MFYTYAGRCLFFSSHIKEQNFFSSHTQQGAASEARIEACSSGASCYVETVVVSSIFLFRCTQWLFRCTQNGLLVSISPSDSNNLF